MIEVIRRGRLPTERSCRGTCAYCHEVVKFLVSDAMVVSDRDGTAYVVKCPTCQNNIWGKLEQ